MPKIALTGAEHAKNNLPDILARWRSLQRGSGVPPEEQKNGGQDARATSELARPRIAQSFCVPKADLANRLGDNGFLLWVRIGNCRTAALLARFAAAGEGIQQSSAAGHRVVILP